MKDLTKMKTVILCYVCLATLSAAENSVECHVVESLVGKDMEWILKDTRSRDNSVDVSIGYGLDNPEAGVRPQ
jgi:hypothetical protein